MIELLVVIAIIAILASLLLPVLGAAKAKGLMTKCRGNVHQIGVALHLYLEDNAQAFPYEVYGRADLQKKAAFWFDGLIPYIAKTQWGQGVFRCPTYRWEVDEGKGKLMGTEIWFTLALGSYAYNDRGIYGVFTGRGGLAGAPNLKLPVREGNIKAPSNMYAIGDTPDLLAMPNKTSGGDVSYRDASINTMVNGGPGSLVTGKTNCLHGSRHNMVFVDGHAGAVRAIDMFSTDLTLGRHWNRDDQ